MAEKHAAYAGAVSREGTVQGEVGPQDEVRFGGVDVGDLVAGAGGQIYIFFGDAAQLVYVSGGDLLLTLVLAAFAGVA